jgi:hypothetical protein
METVIEEQNAAAEIGEGSKLVAQPISEAEKKAVECFKAFQKVDGIGAPSPMLHHHSSEV